VTQRGLTMTNDTLATRTNDAINPRHYVVHPSNVQCIEISRWLSADLSQAFQYVWRCGQKDDPIQELKKAIWFIDTEIDISTSDKQTVTNILAIEELLKLVTQHEHGLKKDALCYIARANILNAPRFTLLCKAGHAINQLIKDYEAQQ